MKTSRSHRKTALSASKKSRGKSGVPKNSARRQLDKAQAKAGQIIARVRARLGGKSTTSTSRPSATSKSVTKTPTVKKTAALAPRKAVKPVVAAAPSPPAAVVAAKPVAPLARRRPAAAALLNTAGKIREATAYHVGSVLDLQLPTAPLRRLSPIKPSPNSRAVLATSKGKRAALSAAKATSIDDAAQDVTDTQRPAV